MPSPGKVLRQIAVYLNPLETTAAPSASVLLDPTSTLFESVETPDAKIFQQRGCVKSACTQPNNIFCLCFAGDHVDEGGCGAGVQGAEPDHRRQEGQRQPRHPRRQAQGKRPPE